MATISFRPVRAFGDHPSGTRARRSFLETILSWQDRASDRAHLMDLDDRLLSDMGIDRAAARFEAAKPFWRA